MTSLVPQSFIPGYRLQSGTDLNEALANPQWSTSMTFEATTGGTAATSAKIVNTITNITSATAGAGVTVPRSAIGKYLHIINSTANTVKVYPEGDATIDGLTSYDLPAGQSITLYGIGTTSWQISSAGGGGGGGIDYYANIAGIRAVTPIAGETALVGGYYVAGDEGGGEFYGATQAAFKATTASGSNTSYKILKVNSVQSGIVYAGMQIYIAGVLYGTILGSDIATDTTVNYIVQLQTPSASNLSLTDFVGKFVDDGGTVILPTGGDGSVAWVRNTDGSDTVNVMWFGAIGDGVTDDAAAANAALAKVAFGGGTVVFPAHNYMFKSQVILNSEAVTFQYGWRNIEISGYGAQIFTQGSIYAFELRKAQRGRKITFQGFLIDHRGNTTALGGIMVWDGGLAVEIQDCIIYASSVVIPEYAGITVAQGTYGCNIRNCTIGPSNSGDGIVPTGVLLLSYCNGTKIIESAITGCTNCILLTTPTIKLENASITPKSVTGIVGSISGTNMTVTAMAGDPLLVGAILTGDSITAGTEIASVVNAFPTGPGGTGVYTVTISQTRTLTGAASASYGILSTTSNSFTNSTYYNSIVGTTTLDSWYVTATNYITGYPSNITIVDSSRITSGPTGTGPYEYVVNKTQTIASTTLYAAINYAPNSTTVDKNLFEGNVNGSAVRIYKDIPGLSTTAALLVITQNRIEVVGSLLTIDGSANFNANTPWVVQGNHIISSVTNAIKNLTPSVAGSTAIVIDNFESSGSTARSGPVKLFNLTQGLDFESQAAGIIENAPTLAAVTYTGFISNASDPTQSGNVLTVVTGAASAAAWTSISGGTTAANTQLTGREANTVTYYNFTTTGSVAAPAVGDTYTNNGRTFTVYWVSWTGSGSGNLWASGTGAPILTASTLTKVGGGTNINYSSAVAVVTTKFFVNIPQLVGDPGTPTTFTQTRFPAISCRFGTGQGIYFRGLSYNSGNPAAAPGGEYGRLVAYVPGAGFYNQLLLSGYNSGALGTSYPLSLGFVGGISSTTTPAKNFTNTVTITNPATTVTVTFPAGFAEVDANYKVFLDLPYNTVAFVTSKLTTGFTINVGTSPGTSETIGWMLVR